MSHQIGELVTRYDFNRQIAQLLDNVDNFRTYSRPLLNKAFRTIIIAADLDADKLIVKDAASLVI